MEHEYQAYRVSSLSGTLYIGVTSDLDLRVWRTRPMPSMDKRIASFGLNPAITVKEKEQMTKMLANGSFLSFAKKCAGLLLAAAIPLAVTSCSGCSKPTVNFTYEQVGACKEFDNLHGTGPNLAYVFFRLTGIDNTKTTADYTFKTGALYLNSDPLISYFDLVTTANLGAVMGLAPAKTKYTVPKGTNLALSNYFVFLVQTVDPDGPKEANQTNYFLLYHNAPGDPGLLLTKSNYSQTSWPYTPNCHQIQFK